MKIISWNIAGLRSVLNKGFNKFVKDQDPDILCLQETKVNKSYQFNLPGYELAHWNYAEKKGYSGTAIFTRQKPIKATYGLGLKEHDSEGRVITLEFPKFFVITVYTPNSQRGLARLDYRMSWDKDFLEYMKKLSRQKPLIVCGDLNVAHKEIDIANPKANRNNAGFTDKERKSFDNILDAGFIDTFRAFNDKPGQYSYWIYFANARARNIGWRIDYVLVSQDIKSKLKNAFILSKVMGSDHAPVGIDISI